MEANKTETGRVKRQRKGLKEVEGENPLFQLRLQNEVPKHVKKSNTYEDSPQIQQLKDEFTPEEIKI